MSDGANRALWAVIGVVVLAAGVMLGLLHFGLVAGVAPSTELLSDDLLALWRNADGWNLPVLAAVGVLLFAAGLWLFGRQFRRRSAPGLMNLVTRGEAEVRWRTRVRSAALLRALERDLVDRKIVAAHVVMTGRPPQPNAWVRLDVAPGVVVSDVHERVEQCVDRFAATTGLRPRSLEVTVRPSRRSAARVR